MVGLGHNSCLAIEESTRFRHYLACWHRKALCYQNSVEMLKYAMCGLDYYPGLWGMSVSVSAFVTSLPCYALMQQRLFSSFLLNSLMTKLRQRFMLQRAF